MGESIFQGLLRKQAYLKASELLYKSAQTGEEPDLSPLLDVPTRSESGILVPLSTNLDELLDEAITKPGLRWRLNCLNKSLGSLRAGDFGFIFARPETGKTTFLASEVASFIGHTERPIVWFNNEEQGHKVVLRLYQAYFGVRLEQLLANRKKYREDFQRLVGDRLKFYDSATVSKSLIEEVVKNTSPALVIYDQVDKVKGFEADREDLRLGSIYQWARELAKNNHASIGVCQADGSAEGAKWLNMDNVSNAKTAKQAEADWILGIGKIHDPAEEYTRYLNICKNKLFGDQDSIPELKHGKFEVLIEPQVARYRDIVTYD